MKTIYINREPGKKKKNRSWMIFFLSLIAVFLISLRFIAPYAVENYINNKGADEKGYAFRIGDVDLKFLKGEMYLKDVKVFNARSSVNFLEVSVISMNFNWADIIRGERIFSVRGDQIDFILSKDMLEEINRIKDEAKSKTGMDFYLDHIDAFFKKINVKEIEDESTRTIISLIDSNIDVKDIGVGSINEKTEFKVDSNILEGGKMALTGKTQLEADNTPWSIEGSMSGIKPEVIDKLAGDKLPLEIEEAQINAAIIAHSAGGQIEGTLTPDIKEFKLSEEKKEGPIKRTIAKATNLLLDKAKGEDESMKFEIPFTLKENLTLNVQDTIDKLTGKKE